ncbi:MAG: hypothetical protein JWN94_1799 [Betaproteobacteria bacterium]|nr:hypothetical protein [Betaproteobacteria bacterium]
MNFLFGCGQVISIIGLLYGAYTSIAYAFRMRSGHENEADAQAEAPPHSSVGYDALTGHVWIRRHSTER